MRGRDIFIGCDYRQCGDEIHAELGSDTYADLTRQAREEGWSIGKRDFCPEHRSMAHDAHPDTWADVGNPT